METWDKENVLRWIRQRDKKLLQDDDLDKFTDARIGGRAFILSTFDFFYGNCHLSQGVSLVLSHLADEVRKGGKFIPRT